MDELPRSKEGIHSYVTQALEGQYLPSANIDQDQRQQAAHGRPEHSTLTDTLPATYNSLSLHHNQAQVDPNTAYQLAMRQAMVSRDQSITTSGGICGPWLEAIPESNGGVSWPCTSQQNTWPIPTAQAARPALFAPQPEPRQGSLVAPMYHSRQVAPQASTLLPGPEISSVEAMAPLVSSEQSLQPYSTQSPTLTQHRRQQKQQRRQQYQQLQQQQTLQYSRRPSPANSHRNLTTEPGSLVAEHQNGSLKGAELADRNSQAGPHKCQRINPNTGEPCNSIFSRPYDLTRHKHTIHDKIKVRCKYCAEGKSFSRSDALTRHIRVVHPEILGARETDVADESQ